MDPLEGRGVQVCMERQGARRWWQYHTRWSRKSSGVGILLAPPGPWLSLSEHDCFHDFNSLCCSDTLSPQSLVEAEAVKCQVSSERLYPMVSSPSSSVELNSSPPPPFPVSLLFSHHHSWHGSQIHLQPPQPQHEVSDCISEIFCLMPRCFNLVVLVWWQCDSQGHLGEVYFPTDISCPLIPQNLGPCMNTHLFAHVFQLRGWESFPCFTCEWLWPHWRSQGISMAGK